jgi:hypothetical protein
MDVSRHTILAKSNMGQRKYHYYLLLLWMYRDIYICLNTSILHTSNSGRRAPYFVKLINIILKFSKIKRRLGPKNTFHIYFILFSFFMWFWYVWPVLSLSSKWTTISCPMHAINATIVPRNPHASFYIRIWVVSSSLVVLFTTTVVQNMYMHSMVVDSATRM